jgi:hypothetical protein
MGYLFLEGVGSRLPAFHPVPSISRQRERLREGELSAGLHQGSPVDPLGLTPGDPVVMVGVTVFR